MRLSCLFKFITHFIPFTVVFFTVQVSAAQPTFTDLGQDQLDGIYKDLGTIMYPTTVSGASSLGKIFGFEVGILGGLAQSPHLDAVVPENVQELPKAAAMAIVTGPFGLGVEASVLPIKVSGFEYDYVAIGGRWTVNEVFSAIPFIDLKLKVDFTNAELKWNQTVSGVPVDVNYKNKSTAYSMTIGKKLLFIEPYAGLGRIRAKSTLTSTGSVSIFNVSVPLSATQNVVKSTTYYFLGAQLHLFLLNLGVEMAKVYDNRIVVGKLSFGF